MSCPYSDCGSDNTIKIVGGYSCLECGRGWKGTPTTIWDFLKSVINP